MRLLALLLVLASVSALAQPTTESPKRVVIRASNDFVVVGEYGACTFNQARELVQTKYPGFGVEVVAAASVQRAFVDKLVKTLKDAQIPDIAVSSNPLPPAWNIWAPGTRPGQCGANAFLKGS